MRRISNSISEIGFSVTLVGRAKKSSVELADHTYTQKRLGCFFERGLLFYMEYNIRLFIFLFRSDVDVLYSVDLDTILPMTLVSILKRKKHIHDAHEYFVEVPELKDRRIKKAIWNLVARFCYPRCTTRITVNDALAHELKKVYGGSWHSLMNVPLSFDFVPSSNTDKVILYQGMLNEGRGLEQIINAVSSIDLPIQLWIVGKGDIEQKLHTLKDKVDTKEKVKFLGWKTIEEMRGLSSQSWIGINLLSIESKNYYFSLANKFFEYIHCGIPSINMNFPVYRSINTKYETSILLDSLKEDEIKKAIFKLYNNEALYQRLKENTKNLKREYNWEEEELKLKLIIKNIEQV